MQNRNVPHTQLILAMCGLVVGYNILVCSMQVTARLQNWLPSPLAPYSRKHMDSIRRRGSLEQISAAPTLMVQSGSWRVGV